MKRPLRAHKGLHHKGFSLVEIAISLVVIGLMIGGVLRGQELINAGKVRNVMDQMRTVQVAFYGFQDRYNALPGDLTTEQASTVSPRAAVALVNPADGWVPLFDSQQFFNNISLAGFINCANCQTAQVALTNPTADFSPTNLNGQPIGFTYPNALPSTNTDGAYYWSIATVTNEGTKAMVTTGGSINSRILAEIDKKMDDGSPAKGQFRFSDYVPSVNGTINSTTTKNVCLTQDATGADIWSEITPGQCQGVLLL